jgi:hypothetical protein
MKEPAVRGPNQPTDAKRKTESNTEKRHEEGEDYQEV